MSPRLLRVKRLFSFACFSKFQYYCYFVLRMTIQPIDDSLERLSHYDFDLPKELIAQHPAPNRSDSKLLDARSTKPIDRVFKQLPELLKSGDLLIFNDTQVVKARLFGEKISGGRLELLIERVLPKSNEHSDYLVAAHMRVSKKPRNGDSLIMEGGFKAKLIGRWPNEDGPLYLLSFDQEPFTLMQKFGHVPLPPYVEHVDDLDDQQRYQSIFAKHPGAAAAPTASLHFDAELIESLQIKGINHARLTLHIGAGTFQPVKTEKISEHKMHSEWYSIPDDTISAITKCKQNGGRVIAVGTTSVRSLESWAASNISLGETNIFIRPGFKFKVVDLMITNFHLPKSTLLMLVSAFTSHAHVFNLYAHAIENKYRFFSYGDAMLLEKF
jgi:S-adenosylmethionine:tRNA ribosyltransferase-isomerase